MFKFLLGAVAVIALVGYGYITPHDIERAGDTVRAGVNSALERGAELTRKEPTLRERVEDIIK